MIYIDPHFEKMKSGGINVFSIEQRRIGYLEGLKEEMLGDGEILEDMDERQLVGIAKRKDFSVYYKYLLMRTEIHVKFSGIFVNRVKYPYLKSLIL